MGNEKTNAEKNLYMGAGVYAPELATGAEIPFFKRYTFTGGSQAEQAANLMTSPSFRSYWSQGMTDNSHLGGFSRFTDKLVPKAVRMGDFPETVSGIRIDSPSETNVVNQINSKRLDFKTPYRPQFNPTDYELAGMNANGDPIYRVKLNATNLNKTYWDLRNTGGAQLEQDRALLSILKYRNTDPASGLSRYVSNNSVDETLGLASELERHTGARDTQVLSPTQPAKIKFRAGWMRPEMRISDAIMQTNAQLTDERNALLMADSQNRLGTAGKYFIDADGNFAIRPTVSNPADDVAPIGANAEPRPFVARTTAGEERDVGRIRYTRPDNAPRGTPNQTTTVIGPPKFSDILKARGQQALKVGAKGLTGLTLLATPFDAVARRNQYFGDYYREHGEEPSNLMGAGIRLRAGLEPALNAATLGAYDTPRNVQGIMDTTTGLQEAEFYKANKRFPTEEERLQMLQDQYEYSGFYM